MNQQEININRLKLMFAETGNEITLHKESPSVIIGYDKINREVIIPIWEFEYENWHNCQLIETIQQKYYPDEIIFLVDGNCTEERVEHLVFKSIEDYILIFIKQEAETYKKKLLKILIDLETFISEEM